MLPVKVTPPDPAPSRIKYRLERLWMRPVVQRLVRVYLPAIALGVGVALAGTHPTVQDTAQGYIAAFRKELATRPELMVTSVEITGAGSALEQRIAETLDVSLPLSALKMDLGAMRTRVQALDPVMDARLRVTEAGLLKVSVTERIPSVVWRNADGLMLIDDTGAPVDRIADRADYKDLPLIAGQGAADAVDEALRLLKVAQPIAPRVRGLVRVGERRWDLVLDKGLMVRLPENGAEAALSRVLALQFAEDVLDRDVAIIDMRDARRPLLRLNESALQTLRGLPQTDPEGEDV
ncbi:cell division protein FtsQ/DivIB [Halovulum sp. GXIMD14793]